jgi:serine/threonine-protein kinase
MLITLAQCERSLEGMQDEAIAHLQRALPIAEKNNGHDHKQTAIIIVELGIAARGAGKYDEALAYYRDALAIRERLVGPENPDIAGLRNNIANVYRDMKRYDEARAELERAIAIWTKAWGDESPAVAIGNKNIGRIDMLEGNYAKAEVRFRRALEIIRKKRPPGHPDIGLDAGTLGRCLLAQKKAEALALLEESLALLAGNEDIGKLEIAEARFWVARARVELGIKRDGALELAASACAELDDPEMQEEVAECRAWLAARK